MLEFFSVLLVSAMPFSELRVGIPLAISLGFKPYEAFIIAYIGNILPIPFILLFLNKITELFCKVSFFERVYSKIKERTMKKKYLVEKYGYVGLLIFVAVPFPVTGAWTGSLLSFLLGLDPKKSFIAIAAGVAIAGVLVTLISIGFLSFLTFLV
jgi:uncharacterized membrane protein